jgi:hypothetical protein
MLRPEMKSPTAVPAALIKTTVKPGRVLYAAESGGREEAHQYSPLLHRDRR